MISANYFRVFVATFLGVFERDETMREKEEREEGRERRRKRDNEGRERGERMRDNIFDEARELFYFKFF